MKRNKIQGYDVKDRLNCRWCTNFVPFSGNGRKICRLYELGQCKYVDGRLVKKTTESTQIKTQMKRTKKPIKIKEDVSLGDAEPMVEPTAPGQCSEALTKILSIMPEFQGFLDAVGRFVDTNCTVDSTQTMVNEPPIVTEDVGKTGTYEIPWTTNTNSQAKILKELYDSGLDQNVKIEIRSGKYGTSSMPIIRLTGDKDTIKNWIHKGQAYDQETDQDYIDELYLMDGVEMTSEADRADGVGPSNAMYEIDWVSNNDNEKAMLKEIYATGLDKSVQLKIVGNDIDMHPGTAVRLTGDNDLIKKWINNEYDSDLSVDDIEMMYRVYPNDLKRTNESTFIKDLGKRYARLGKLCR